MHVRTPDNGCMQPLCACGHTHTATPPTGMHACQRDPQPQRLSDAISDCTKGSSTTLRGHLRRAVPCCAVLASLVRQVHAHHTPRLVAPAARHVAQRVAAAAQDQHGHVEPARQTHGSGQRAQPTTGTYAHNACIGTAAAASSAIGSAKQPATPSVWEAPVVSSASLYTRRCSCALLMHARMCGGRAICASRCVPCR